MDMNEYQRLAARTINRNLFPFEQIDHALHGLCAEVGEIHGIYQKKYQGHPIDGNHVMKELGDMLWFIAEYCTAQGLDLAEVAQMNIDKLKARYPEGFDSERSLHRQKGDI